MSAWNLFTDVDTIENTVISNSSIRSGIGGNYFNQCLFDNNVSPTWGSVYTWYDNKTIKNCVFNNTFNFFVKQYPNNPDSWYPQFLYNIEWNSYLRSYNNSFLNNGLLFYFIRTIGSNDYVEFSNQYWGTSDTTKVTDKIYDFWDDAGLPMIILNPILTAPSDSCPGHVWKVLVNGKDAQDEVVNPVDIGIQKFEVYFNRAMDTTVTPVLSFGLRYPFMQNIVQDSASWSSDRKRWTAYFNVQLYTGDGINTIRVGNAVDTAGFTIPVENTRFKFVIQATGVQSVNFMATPGIGKVDLEWNNTGLIDFLGFNMYRYMKLTDSTYSTPQIINTSLITDTVYTDFNIIPDSTYRYYYKVVNTDFKESDSSRIVTATPFSTATGDANGDLSVSVLDITTIVSYMLNQNPTPFLFDAADVNYDNQINVLDIIGVVQLINSKKSLPLKPLPGYSKEVAWYTLNDGLLNIESKGNIAALQFEMKIADEESSTEKLEQIRIFCKQQGFEFAYAVTEDHIIGILYSLTEKEIPEGIVTVFKLMGVNTNDLEISKIVGGDRNGNYVPVFKKGMQPADLGNEVKLEASPNPFNNFTTINYLLPEDGKVTVELYNLSGTMVNQLAKGYRPAGEYSLRWFGTDKLKRKLNRGIYLLRLTFESESGNKYHREIKVVLVK
jgi:hypothetical protein